MIKLKLGDIIIIAVILIMAVSIFFLPKLFINSEKKIAVISVNGQIYKKIDLNEVKEPLQIVLPYKYNNVIEVSNGTIKFKSSDCPDKLCVKSGELKNVGDFAACLPNKVSISIVGDNAYVDSVSK